MNQNTEEINRCALLVVACNSILLDVCDTLKETALYRQQIKRLTNQLTAEIERFMVTLYQGMSEEEEQQYYALVRTVEAGVHQLTTCTPQEIDILTAMLNAHRAGKVEITPEPESV